MPSLLQLAFVLLAGAQAPQPALGTVDTVIAKMPWDVAHDGPLFAVCPLSMAKGPSLDDLDRRKAVVGGLTAIVPKTMVTVNSRFTVAPNMYEGLPQEAKVMYLLRSLTPAQWAKATGDGIAMADLRGEQVAVMDSILPKPLVYHMGSVNENRGVTPVGSGEGAKTLAGDDRAKVRLRVVRQLWLYIAIGNNGGYSAAEIQGEDKVGTVMPYLQEDKDGLFGHKALVTGPNLPRKSQLSLADGRLGAQLPLVPLERVDECLARIAKATGLRLVADPHFVRMPIVERGESASARDMLGALTLGVAGTFRRVGDTYVLTNDLEGMAAHQARIAAWEDALTKEVSRRMDLWRGEIASSPNFRRIPFSSPLYDSLSSTEQANVAANDKWEQGNVYIPTHEASKSIQDTMRTLKNGLDVDREKVGIASNVRYEIVLPGVGRAWWRGWLGNGHEFKPKPYVWAPPSPNPVTLPLETKGAVASLVVRADTAAEAKGLVDGAARTGVGELLLETRSPEVLRTAIQAGTAANVKVGLAVRPWALGPGEPSADPDRTAAGEHGPTLAASRAAMSQLQDFWQDIQAYEPPVREIVSPLDPSIQARIISCARLAGTPGLSRVLVLDLYPAGYARADSNVGDGFFYSNAVENYLAYGYTNAMRAAFLRDEKVDPLDLSTDHIRTQTRLERAWGEAWTTGGASEKWQKTKGDRSHERALALARALRAAAPALPLIVAGEPPKTHLPPLPFTNLYLWDGRNELPVAVEDYGVSVVPEATAFQMLELKDDRDPEQRNRVADKLSKAVLERKRPLMLDLSSVSPTRLKTVIAMWLKDKTP